MPHKENEVYALVVGKTIALLRERSGWRQDQLAEKVGIAQPTLSRIERGQTEPSASLLREFARTFNMTLPSLCQRVEDTLVRMEESARASMRGSPHASWWEPVVAMAGAAGLMALVALAISAVEEQARPSQGSGQHARQTADRAKRTGRVA